MLFAGLGSGVVMTRSRHLIAFPTTTWTQTGLLKALCDGALANFLPGLSPPFNGHKNVEGFDDFGGRVFSPSTWARTYCSIRFLWRTFQLAITPASSGCNLEVVFFGKLNSDSSINLWTRSEDIWLSEISVWNAMKFLRRRLPGLQRKCRNISLLRRELP